MDHLCLGGLGPRLAGEQFPGLGSPCQDWDPCWRPRFSSLTWQRVGSGASEAGQPGPPWSPPPEAGVDPSLIWNVWSRVGSGFFPYVYMNGHDRPSCGNRALDTAWGTGAGGGSVTRCSSQCPFGSREKALPPGVRVTTFSSASRPGSRKCAFGDVGVFRPLGVPHRSLRPLPHQPPVCCL